MNRLSLVVVAALLVACPKPNSQPGRSDGAAADAGGKDGGKTDAGGPDGGGDDGGTSDGGGSGDGGTVAPTVTFAANPTSIHVGETASLQWSVQGATSIDLSDPSGPIASGLSANGSRLVTPGATTVYTLTATGPGGTTSADAQVEVLPALAPVITSFTALSADIGVGKDGAVSWKTQNAAKVEITNGAGTSIFSSVAPAEVANGSHVISALAATDTFTLTATGPGGSASATVTITVHAAPTVLSFTATPPNVLQGATSTLAFSATDCTSVKITDQSGNDLGIDPAVFTGSATVTPSQATTYTFTASSAYGDTTATATVTVLFQASVVSFTATPSTVASGGSVALAWDTLNATGVTLEANGVLIAGAPTSPTGTYSDAPTVDTTYTLTAIGTGGNATATQSVTLIPPPGVTFSAAPNPGTAGQDVTFSWTTTNATAVTGDFRAAPSGTSLIDISATGRLSTATGDNGTAAREQIAFPSGFTFPWYGTPRSNVTVSVNGWMGFLASYTSSYDFPISLPSTSDPKSVIAAFWDDLHTRTTGHIYTELRGTAPNRVFIVMWKNMQFYSSSANPSDLSFEALLHEDGSVEIVFGSMSSANGRHTGTSAAVGYDNDAGTAGFAYSYNAAIPAGSVLFLTSIPDPLPLSGSVTYQPSSSVTHTLKATGPGGTTQRSVTEVIYARPVVNAFTATPGHVAVGDPSTLAWTATDATQVTLTDGSGGAPLYQGPNLTGTVVVNPAVDTTYTLKAENAAGFADTRTVIVRAGGAQVLSFTAAPATVPLNSPVTFTWTTSGAASLVIQNAGGTIYTAASQADRDAGSFLFTPAATDTYTIVASNGSGSDSKTATVTVFLGVVVNSYTAAPDKITVLGSSTLAWNIDNATSLDISDGTASVFSSSDLATVHASSIVVSPTATTTYTLTATGPNGSQNAAVTVNVYPIPTAGIYASAGSIDYGSPVTVAWNSSGAVSVKLERGATDLGISPTAFTGSHVDTAGLGGVYKITATNGAGATAAATTTVTIKPPPPPTFTATPPLIAQGGTSTLSWNAPKAASVSISPAPVALVSGNFEDISATGTALSFSSLDDATSGFTFPAGFTFPWYGVPQTAAVASTNGWLGFNASYSTSVASNSLLPDSTSSAKNMIAALWDDLKGTTGTSTVKWALLGSAPNRKLIVQWTAFDFYASAGTGSNLNFEVKLLESGDVEIAWGPMTGPNLAMVQGSSATAGYQDAAGTSGATWSYNTAAIQQNTGIVYSLHALPATGTLGTMPRAKTVYTLSSVNPGGTASASATVDVIAAGALAITEMMPAASAPLGQWFEVLNTTAAAIDLRGIAITEPGSGFSHAIASGTAVNVPPGGYVVIAQSTDVGQNGGVTAAYGWGATALPASGALTLSLGGVTLDAFPFGGAGWPGALDKSVGLAKEVTRSQTVANDVAAYRCAERTVSGALTATPGAANDACYAWTATPGTNWIDASAGTNLGITSSTSWANAVALPFTFNYFGQSYTAISVDRHGYATFETLVSANSTGTNQQLGDTAAPAGVIAPFWDYQYLKSPGPSAVFTTTVGTTPNQKFVIEWQNFSLASSSGTDTETFEVILGEDGSIEFQWNTVTGSGNSSGGSATIGIESADGLLPVTKGYNLSGTAVTGAGAVLTRY